MGTAGDNSLSCLGFVTVVESPPHGLFGGYLVLDAAGRPLEFHCTAPVKSNRVQKILYGSTLEPFLYGELIAKTLLASSTTRPGAVLTDQRAVLAVRSQVELPVVLVQRWGGSNSPPGEKPNSERPNGERPNGEKNEEQRGTDKPHVDVVQADGLRRETVEIGGCLLEMPSSASEGVVGQLRSIAAHLDLAEPFDRIREAINEAQRIGHATRDVA